jgi:putative proteasome-type protease
MTYCVAIKLNAGLVFLSDSRTNAGLDQISTFRKMIVYEKPGDRFMCLLSAGNLSISQSIREILQTEQLKDSDSGDLINIWNAKSMFDAARVLGSAVRHIHQRDGEALKRSGVDFNVSMIFGGQIQGLEPPRNRSGVRSGTSQVQPRRPHGAGLPGLGPLQADQRPVWA